MTFVNFLKCTICDHNRHVFIQHLTVNHGAPQYRHPEMWHTALKSLSFLKSFDDSLATPYALMTLRRVNQWQRYILYWLQLTRNIITFPLTIFGYIMDSCRCCLFPFAPEFLVRLRQFCAQTFIETCYAFKAIKELWSLKDVHIINIKLQKCCHGQKSNNILQ